MTALLFLPSFIIPFCCSISAVYFYSRILPATEYGLYVLLLGGIMFSQQCLFSWLQMGAKRFAARDTAYPKIASTIYGGYAVCSVVALAVYLAIRPYLKSTSWLIDGTDIGFAILLAQALLLINQGFVLAGMQAARFTLIECTVPVVSLLTGLTLVGLFGLGANGVLLGLLAGVTAGLVLDAPHTLARMRQTRMELTAGWMILLFGLPLALSYALEYMLAAADRFLLLHFTSEQEVGIYALSYSFAERLVTSLFLAFSVGGYSAVMRALERQGQGAAQEQARKNIALVLSVAIPACGGLIAANRHLAVVVLGAEYATQAAIILPWIAVAAFLNAIKLHYYDHAFHYSRKTGLNVLPTAVAVVINLVLNLLLLPWIGWMGAIYATLAAYVIALMLSIGLGRRVFPLPFPLITAAKALGATLIMFIIVRTLDLPPTISGLVGLVFVGIAVYGGLALGLNISELRTEILPHALRAAKSRLLAT